MKWTVSRLASIAEEGSSILIFKLSFSNIAGVIKNRSTTEVQACPLCSGNHGNSSVLTCFQKWPGGLLVTHPQGGADRMCRACSKGGRWF